MLLLEEDFLLELAGTPEGALSFGEVQHAPSYFCNMALWAGEYGGCRCPCLCSLQMPFPEVYTQNTQRWLAWVLHGVCRDRVERDFMLHPAYVVTVLCPIVKGAMKALCDPSICTLAS